jgi:hypothetical protein
VPIFISYSHQNADFVDRLALQLVQHRVNVWMDRWELHVGDSLLTKVQEAITGASALLVVLSQASVASEWVSKEINAGLLRELEERKVVVLPVLVEDCAVPIFLRDKLYADFRSDFDHGIRMVLESVARVSTASLGRIEEPDYYTDWSVEWGSSDAHVAIRVTLVEQPQRQPYTVLGVVEIRLDSSATSSYLRSVEESGLEAANSDVVAQVAAAVSDVEFRLTNELELVSHHSVKLVTGSSDVQVSARRLGVDTGRDVLYRAGQQLEQLVQQMRDVLRNSQ